MLENQGLLGIAFFESTALIIMLVLFFLFRRDNNSSYFRLWLAGWTALTLSSLCELALLSRQLPGLRLATVLLHTVALLFFLSSMLTYTATSSRKPWPFFPALAAITAAIYAIERTQPSTFGHLRWETAILQSVSLLTAGWVLWRSSLSRQGHGPQLLAGALMAAGLHGIDRPLWSDHPLFLLRISFDHLFSVALGIATVVLVLETARNRTDELNDKMRRLTLLTTASTQTLSVQDVLDRVLALIVESLGATHGMVRLKQGVGDAATLVIRAEVGFSIDYVARFSEMSVAEPWARRLLDGGCQFLRFEDEKDAKALELMAEVGLKELITLVLPGKEGPLGIMAVGSTNTVKFQPDELSYLVNIANLLGLTLQNVHLFEQVATVQRQWADTFDSIGDPIFVHDPHGRIIRTNQRLLNLLGRSGVSHIGRDVSVLFSSKNANYVQCPYCEGVAGEGDDPDPWLPGFFLASNSTFSNPTGKDLGIVHVLKDITDRKRAEEKYRTLIANVQEGVFISTPQGRFLDFNDALLRMTGYDTREELLNIDISTDLFEVASERDRLKRLLQQHGNVADFEFAMKRKDGEIRNVLESSVAVRDASGAVIAYQGFVLDISERKHAEQEIRRRNRELMVLNSIGQTLTESMDLSDSLHRTLRQLSELFKLDASSLYLFDESCKILRRIAAVGHRSEYAFHFDPVSVQAELLNQVRAVHAKFLSTNALLLPPALRDVLKKEDIVSSHVAILWSKDRVIGFALVGARTAREFSPADVNLLIAVGGQIASAVERALLYDETRQAYDNLRRTQEQLLHSEKMAAVGQLISGVAHELNNPLTAILGYSQLLTSSGQVGPQGLEYSQKLYKQAQRTHRIVQNLLSFARQHKPERAPVRLNQVLEDTLALRDYDLRMSNIRVHLDLAGDLPVTAADPHQLQQVFLNIVNNAVDAILADSADGDLWVRTGKTGDFLFVEFIDSGPGVQEASRVFDPFYTTKPVGKGTGLGLSICYGIIVEHGGTLRVRNVPSRGASFTIELPCNSAVQEVQPTVWEPTNLRNAFILVVDQDPSVLEAVSAILNARGHRVHIANDAAEAKTLLDKFEFDLIVADLQAVVPESGERLESWLIARRPALLERIIFMCATAPRFDAISSRRRVVLQKPFKAAELLDAVDASLLADVHSAAIER